MPDDRISALPTQLADALRAELDEGEQVLWCGQPDAVAVRRSVRLLSSLFAGFAACIAGTALFRIAQEAPAALGIPDSTTHEGTFGSDFLITMACIALVAIVCTVLLFRTPAVAERNARNTTYTLTSVRLITIVLPQPGVRAFGRARAAIARHFASYRGASATLGVTSFPLRVHHHDGTREKILIRTSPRGLPRSLSHDLATINVHAETEQSSGMVNLIAIRGAHEIEAIIRRVISRSPDSAPTRGDADEISLDTLPPVSRERLTRVLDPGERVLWCGRPAGLGPFSPLLALCLITALQFGVAAGLLAARVPVLWREFTHPATGVWGGIALAGTLSVLVLVATVSIIALTTPLIAARRKASHICAVTNRRLIRIRPARRSSEVASLIPGSAPDVAERRGSVLMYPHERAKVGMMTFEGIREPERVATLIRETFQERAQADAAQSHDTVVVRSTGAPQDGLSTRLQEFLASQLQPNEALLWSGCSDPAHERKIERTNSLVLALCYAGLACMFMIVPVSAVVGLFIASASPDESEPPLIIFFPIVLFFFGVACIPALGVYAAASRLLALRAAIDRVGYALTSRRFIRLVAPMPAGRPERAICNDSRSESAACFGPPRADSAAVGSPLLINRRLGPAGDERLNLLCSGFRCRILGLSDPSQVERLIRRTFNPA